MTKGSAGWRIAAMTAACIIAIACGSARRREPLASPMPLSEKAARGQVAYMAHCHQCHPGGEAGLGPAINDKPFPEFLKKFQVRHGLGVMPSFPKEKLSDEQLDDIMEYLSALRRAQPRRATPGAPGLNATGEDGAKP